MISIKISHVHQYAEEDLTPSQEITLDIAPEQYIDDLGLFEDKKEFVKFMFRQEKLIRDSFEMEEAIEFLKRKHGMDHCGVHPNVTRDKGFRIELHHTPFTLFDIVSAVVNKRLQKEESLKMTDIAAEVMQLHYLELCGLYPLDLTCHLFQHNDDHGGFFIPLDKVYGDPKTFAQMYYPYFSEALKTKWDNFLVLDQGYAIIDHMIPKELQRKYIYIKADDGHGHQEDAVSTSKLIDFIKVLNDPKDPTPKAPEEKRIILPDNDRDEEGFYVLRRHSTR